MTSHAKLAVVYSRAQNGMRSPLVTVEVHVANGLPALTLVGLPETAVKESKDRVRSAIQNAGFEFPAKRITINLAPADLPKEGGRFDLPIAIGILAASGQLVLPSGEDNPLKHVEISGELALSGALRPFAGALPAALAARENQRAIILPIESAHEASLVNRAKVYAADHLLQVCAMLLDKSERQAYEPTIDAQALQPDYPCLSDVIGQQHAKRALTIAAAGGHNLLLLGPPGTGKTMLASRFPGLLPAMSEAEALEIAAVQSISQQGFKVSSWKQRPYRHPHHSSSTAALVGGGSIPKPGEISLAHQGVLFLDEMPEFAKPVLEALREPMETAEITISRVSNQVVYPANFQLIATMNPCPCGYQGDSERACQCTPDQIKRYRAKISGPLLDRIDMHLRVPRLPTAELQAANDGHTTTVELSTDTAPDTPNTSNTAGTSRHIAHQVATAQAIQQQRQSMLNASLDTKSIKLHCFLDTDTAELLSRIMQKLQLSPRAYHRILRVARTIADLAGAEKIQKVHVQEAISMRALDRV